EAFKINAFNLSINYSSLYLVLGQAANIIGVVLAKPVSDKIGKKNTFGWAMVFASILSVFFFYFKEDDIILIFIFQFLISVCAGSIFPLLWSMYADIADYSEWKTGRRATGLIFSSSSMSQKLGWTLGGALTGWLLAMFGFEANTLQEAGTQTGLRMMMSFIPAAGAIISAAFILTYSLSEQKMTEIEKDLNERRKQ
ncbi:MAG TPA: MFS transporter, partial [Ginsengibacter sp.]|nr:MFS transporter [Ginsengibacter sp.]